MADIKVIGAVAVKVRPDASGFRESTKRKILDELKNFEADVKVDLDIDERDLESDVRAAKKRVEKNMKLSWRTDFNDVEEGIKKAEKRLAARKPSKWSMVADVEDASIDSVIRELEDAIAEAERNKIDLEAVAHTAGAAAQMRYTTRPRFIDIFARINKRSLAIVEGAIQSLAGVGVLRSMGNALEDIVINFDKVAVKTGLVGAGLAGIVNTLSYVTTSLLTIGEDVFKAVGLLAMAPAALAATTATIAITVAAFEDFADAVDGSAEALAQLPPEAQRAAKALRGTWEMIQEPVQNAFWEGMGDSMAELVEVIIPQFRDGLTKAAAHVGDFAQGVMESFKSIALSGALESMFDDLSEGFDRASGAARPLVDAINTLGLRGSEYLPQFGQWITDVANRFNDWIQAANDAGDINRWIEEGIESLQDMWRVGEGVVNMFRGLTRAASQAGMEGLDEFADSMQRIGDMMMAEPFQSRMATIFEGANKGASELNEGLMELGETIGEASEFVGELLTKLGTLGGGVLKGLATAISQIEFQEGMLDSLDGMNQLVGDLTPTFEALGRVVGSFGSIAGDVFRNLAPVINTVMNTLDEGMDSLGPALEKLAPALAELLNSLVRLVSGPLLVGIELLSTAVEGLAAAPPILRDILLVLGGIAALKMGGFFTSFQRGMQSIRKASPIMTTFQAGFSRQVVMLNRSIGNIGTRRLQGKMSAMTGIVQRGTRGIARGLSGGR